MITSEKAEKEHKKLKSLWSNESCLTQKILISILKELEILNTKKVKREPSKYNLHVAKEIGKGKTFQEAVTSYKK